MSDSYRHVYTIYCSYKYKLKQIVATLITSANSSLATFLYASFFISWNPHKKWKKWYGERSNYLSVRDLVPARCFYKSMHSIPQITQSLKFSKFLPNFLSIRICNHFKTSFSPAPFKSHLRFLNSTLWKSMPVHENPANRHTRTTRSITL